MALLSTGDRVRRRPADAQARSCRRAAGHPRRPRRPARLLRAGRSAWTPRTVTPLQAGDLPAAGRGHLRHRRAGGHRRHRRRHRLPVLLHRHRGRPAGLRGARPARHVGVHRLPLGVLQHPRDRAAGRRRWRCRRRSAAGFTAQIGAMRINEEIDALEVMGVPVAAVPRDHPHRRRLHRRHPALRAGPAHQLLRHAADRHPGVRRSRRAPTTTTSTCSCHRRTCCGRSCKVLVFAVVIILIHCYYGYRASGGPGRRRAWPSAARCASRSSRSTSSTSSCPWPSGARRRPSGSRGERRDEQGRSGSARSRAWRSSSSWRCCSACRSRTYKKAFTEVAPRDAGDRHRGQPAAGGLRRQGPRRDRRRRARGRGERRRAPRSSWRINPEYLDQIPADVSARLLPKTLFGERFVALRAARDAQPASGWPTATSSAQDRSENAIELQRVIDDTAPAAAGRRSRRTSPTPSARSPTRCAAAATTSAPTWPRPASTSARSTPSCRSCRPTSPLLADFADTYDGRGRRPARRPGQPRRHQHDRSSTSRSSCAGRSPSATARPTTTAGFLETNERNIISLAETSRPVLGAVRRVLAELPLPARGAHPVAPRDRRRPSAATATRR